jgi:hypothetical protein
VLHGRLTGSNILFKLDGMVVNFGFYMTGLRNLKGNTGGCRDQSFLWIQCYIKARFEFSQIIVAGRPNRQRTLESPSLGPKNEFTFEK